MNFKGIYGGHQNNKAKGGNNEVRFKYRQAFLDWSIRKTLVHCQVKYSDFQPTKAPWSPTQPPT